MINTEFHDLVFFQDTIRSKMKAWYDDSRKYHNYRCVITGLKTTTIHHVISLKQITLETLDFLNLPVKSGQDYTINERNAIFKKCLELHYKYGYGACMLPKLHKLLHAEYSNTPTEENYKEFVIKYKQLIANGEYKVINSGAKPKENKNGVMVNLKDADFSQAQEQAKKEGRTLSNWIEQLIKQEIERTAQK